MHNSICKSVGNQADNLQNFEFNNKSNKRDYIYVSCVPKKNIANFLGGIFSSSAGRSI